MHENKDRWPDLKFVVSQNGLVKIKWYGRYEQVLPCQVEVRADAIQAGLNTERMDADAILQDTRAIFIGLGIRHCPIVENPPTASS